MLGGLERYKDSPILKKLLSRKGQFVRIIYSRPLKLRASLQNCGVEIIKQTEITVRCGLNYENRTETIVGRRTGELPAKNAGLRGEEWIVPNYVMRSTTNNNLLFRFYASDYNACPFVSYLYDGAPMKREEVEPLVLKGETDETIKPVFNIKLDSIKVVK